ncbi:MAG: ATP-binding protein [Phycisphaerae bacterium]|nr:ATP-binding protein [Phycisphaerae bacterium]
MPTIQVMQGPDKGRRFELQDDENIIGRNNSSIELSDRTMSRQHARIYPDGKTWILEDLGSANGTFLNGTPLAKPTSLKRGDQIRCGASVLVFGGTRSILPPVDVDENGRLVDASIVATIPSNEDSIIIPTPEAGARAIENLRILYTLISEVGSLLNVDALLEHTLERVVEILKADRGYIMLVNSAGRLAVRASHLPEGSADKRIPISRTIINEVIARQIGVLSTNAMSDKRFTSGKSVHDYGIRSAICVPIKGREKILGVIHLDCSVSDQIYSTEQLRLLTAIGYQTGLAVENVWLYESAVLSERLAATGETVAVLSHHIKNILQAMVAGMDVVEMGLKGDDLGRAKGAWPIVQRNLGRVNDLILNMLMFSKNRQPLLEHVNINHVLTECIELTTPRADEKGIAILSDLEDLPPIPADLGGLQQAFLNLLTNAIDAVSEQTGVITVSSRYDHRHKSVIISAVDNGSGIPEDKLDQIFTPFFSAKGQQGTGLGLAVAQKVVKEHQGRIEVASKVGEGTTFTVTLPAVHVGKSEDTNAPTR